MPHKVLRNKNDCLGNCFKYSSIENHLKMGADTKGFKIQINKEPVAEVIVLPKENY